MNSITNRSSIESSNQEKKTKPRDLYIAQLKKIKMAKLTIPKTDGIEKKYIQVKNNRKNK